MIAPPGYEVLSDFAKSLVEAFVSAFDEDFGEFGHPPSFPVMEAAECALWEVFGAQSEWYAYSAQGNLHCVSGEVCDVIFGRDCFGRFRTTFAFFDIQNMMIDSTKPHRLSIPLSERPPNLFVLFDEIYSPRDWYFRKNSEVLRCLDGCFLTLPKGKLPNIEDVPLLKAVKQGSASETECGPLTERAITHRLANMAASGEFPRREDFRAQYASHIKVDAFRYIWRSVAAEHPGLSKPGPKK